jgi:hypothetical protein
MGGKYGVAAVTAWLVAAPGLAHAVGREVLYLNFSDGTEDVTRSDVDDATRNRSMMGSVTAYPAFAWPGMDDADARRAVVADLTRQIDEAFAPYDIVVTSTRPVAGPYTMVMVGGDPALFQMDPRVAGVAFMDCENRQEGNVVFAFPAPLGGSVHGLFTTIAQEAAHAFGLQHSSDPNDLMYPRVDLSQRSFQDRDSAVASPKYCDGDIQNSHRRLLQLVGAWKGGDKATAQAIAASHEEPAEVMGGCSAAGTQRSSAGPWGPFGALLLVFALRACGRGGRRL